MRMANKFQLCRYLPGVLYYTKTDLVFGFSKNQILVAVIPGQKAPRTLLGQNSFRIIVKNHFEMSINKFEKIFAVQPGE